MEFEAEGIDKYLPEGRDWGYLFNFENNFKLMVDFRESIEIWVMLAFLFTVNFLEFGNFECEMIRNGVISIVSDLLIDYFTIL